MGFFLDQYRSQLEQEEPAPDEAAAGDESSLFGSVLEAGGSALGTLGTVLDTLGRPVRTLLHTGDIGRAWDSTFNPDAAASTEDLKRDIGIGDFNQGEGLDFGDVADFAVNTGIGMATDPMTYVGLGLATGAGKTAASAGRSAAAQLARGAEREVVEQGFKRATGKALTSELMQPGAAPGLAKSLGSRLASGEQSLLSARVPLVGEALGLPEVELIGKGAAPLVSAIEKRAGIAADILGQTGVGRKVVDAAGWVRDFMLNPFAGDATAEAGRIAQAYGQEQMIDIQRSISGVREEFAKSGIDYTRYAEPIHKIITSVDKTGDIRVAEFNDGLAALSGLSEGQRDKVVELARKVVGIGQRTRHVLAQEGVEIGELGGTLARDAAKHVDRISELSEIYGVNQLTDTVNSLRQQQLTSHEDMVQAVLGEFNRAAKAAGAAPRTVEEARIALADFLDPNAVQAAVDEHRVFKALVEDAETRLFEANNKPALIRARAKLGETERAIANVPNWVPLVATDDFMRQAIKTGRKAIDFESPDIRLRMMRKFQEEGRPLTAIEANAAVTAKGTEALGGEAVKGKLPLGRAIQALWDGDEKAASEVIGKAFEVDPLVALEAKTNAVASSLEKAKLLNGVRRIYGEGAKRVGAVDASDLGEQMRGVMLPREVYDRLQKQFSTARDPGKLLSFVPFVREANRAWKAAQTLPFPAFHARNKIGNWLRRFQEGAFDLSAEGMAEEGKAYQALAKFGLKSPVGELERIQFRLGDKSMNGAQLMQLAVQEGVIGTGQWAVEVTPELVARKGLIQRGLEMEVKGVSAKKIAQYTEDSDRLASFVAFMRKGNSPEMAAHLVEKTLFNYRNVGKGVDFLRQSGIAPFAAWAAKNVPAQIENFIRKPGDFVALLHMKRAVEQGVPGVSEADLPQWARERFGISYRRNDDGSVDFVTADGIVPAADLPQIADMGSFLKSYLGPMPRVLVESLLNRDMFTGKKIEEFNGQLDLLRLPFAPGGGLQVDPMTANVVREGLGRGMAITEQMGRVANEGAEPSAAGAVISAFNPIPTKNAPAEQVLNVDIQNAREELAAAKRGLRYWTPLNRDMAQGYALAVKRLEARMAKLTGRRSIAVP